jgi:hypothetical protein
MYPPRTGISPLPPDTVAWLYDNEDIENWLVEEGIGYRNRQGNFEYGISPGQIDDTDIPGSPCIDARGPRGKR